MRVLFETSKNKRKIKSSIRKYGHFSEHNFHHYMHSQTSGDKNVFFDFGNSKGMLMQFNRKNNVWSLFPCGILAPEDERFSLLMEATRFVLNRKRAKKLTVEVSESLRKEILKKFSHNGFRVCTYTNILYWPVFDMKLWDNKLKGKEMKKLRNIKNRFYRRHRVRIRDGKRVPYELISEIFNNWLRKRQMHDSVDKEYYLNVITNNFEGADNVKTIYVDGKPATVTAGWKIPNSNNYYSSIGFIDYSIEHLGEIANIDDLNRIKREGYDYADFGGSDKLLLNFKRKFKPADIYKTYLFSIVRR